MIVGVFEAIHDLINKWYGVQLKYLMPVHSSENEYPTDSLNK